jgi:hypothetical protein
MGWTCRHTGKDTMDTFLLENLKRTDHDDLGIIERMLKYTLKEMASNYVNWT